MHGSAPRPGLDLPCPGAWRDRREREKGMEHRYDDEGMATVEYALVTVAAAGFAGLLVVILKSNEVRGLLLDILRGALGG